MNAQQIIGNHPPTSHPLGIYLVAKDQTTNNGVPQRTLSTAQADWSKFKASLVEWVINHHASPEMLKRDKKRRDALARQGFQDPCQRFPNNSSTQKGNWAEILLAEYLKAASDADLPVYRLRYNPNVDQSMKGDDVLLFDFTSDPVRILVGEAKFRATPTKVVVEELIDALEKSHSGNIPASLQFVADRLFESNESQLGEKVAGCNALAALGNLQLDYVGLLVSNQNAHSNVKNNAKSGVARLAVMSLGLNDPTKLVTETFSDVASKI